MHDNAYRIVPCREGDTDQVEARLRADSDAYAPPREGVDEERIIFKIVDDEGRIIAGVVAKIDSWGVLAVDDLWVDKHYRKLGLGSLLLAAAEDEAREMGCYLSLLGTCDFQGEGFYEKRGYELFNIWEDFPRGHTNYSLAKRLDEESPAPYLLMSVKVLCGEEEDAEYINDKLVAYNHARVPYLHPYTPIERKTVDDEGNLVAVCVAGVSGWELAFLEMVWVEPPHRGRGIGRALLADVEHEAREQGAYVLFAGAYDWQVDFFVKCGYTVTGELPDCPEGHVYYSLEKRL